MDEVTIQRFQPSDEHNESGDDRMEFNDSIDDEMAISIPRSSLSTTVDPSVVAQRIRQQLQLMIDYSYLPIPLETLLSVEDKLNGSINNEGQCCRE